MKSSVLTLSLLVLLTSFVAINDVQSNQTVNSVNTINLDLVPDILPLNNSYAPINITLGSPVSIFGNESVQLNTPSGVYINVTPSSDVEITINETSYNPAGEIQSELISLGTYLDIEMNDTSVDIDATIAIPYNKTMLGNMTASSLELRFYNETSKLWEAVPSWVDLGAKMIYGNSTHFSIWTIAGSNIETNQGQNPPERARPGTPYKVKLGSPVSVVKNESVQLITPSGIYVNVTPSNGVEITMNQTSLNPVGKIQRELTSLGIFLDIEMNDTSVDVDVTIAIPYNGTMLRNMNASSLELRFYNETSKLWEAVPSWVDLDAKVIYGNSTHFSIWTATGTSTESDQGQLPPVGVPERAIPGIPFEVKLGSPVAIYSGDRVKLVTPSGASISVTPGSSVEITIDEFDANPKGEIPSQFSSLGIYLTIELNETDVEIDATLELPFQSDEVANTAIESLTFRFYNEDTSTWDAVPSWVEGNIIYANTSHFSTWTVTSDAAIIDEITTLISEDGALPLTMNMLLIGLFTIVLIYRKKKY